jgi:hypothetical protein
MVQIEILSYSKLLKRQNVGKIKHKWHIFAFTQDSAEESK